MTKKFSDLRQQFRSDPANVTLVDEYRRVMEAVMKLTDLRLQRGMTQAQLAELLEVSQANISRVEHQDDLYLSTLRGYIEALGGELEITAKFPDGETIKIA